ncbi:MAG TPA: type I-U CRISPR-associated protein Cas7, partial [Verrucomicrobiota bacterium]|nr:type I-U CRISPR-associated protein Cas7 [Verrucomicrobiota bacterium]
HGGVIADGGVRRDATLALAALKLIQAGSDKEATLRLQRYILGLALVAFTRLPGGYIRQGTLLVSDTREGKGRESCEVYPDGKRETFTVTHEQALAFAKDASAAFGVGENQKVVFDAKLADADLKEAKKEGKGGRKGKKADAANPGTEAEQNAEAKSE